MFVLAKLLTVQHRHHEHCTLSACCKDKVVQAVIYYFETSYAGPIEMSTEFFITYSVTTYQFASMMTS